MSGHSHWATIKRKKGAADAKRGQAFSKCARALTLAARTGGGDPATNLTLRYAMDEARAVNMPKDSIDRAIKKGTGDLAGAVIEQILYEAYAPGGVAVLVDVVTDNRNRTASEITKIFERHGGHMGQPGCVGWMFSLKGVLTVTGFSDEEKLMDLALGAGAEDLTETEGAFEVITPPETFEAVKAALAAAGVPVERAEVAQRPQNFVPLDEAAARKVLSLMEALEDHDDVQKVHANFDIPTDVLEKIQAG